MKTGGCLSFVLAVILAFCFAATAFTGTAFAADVPEPGFSVQGGIFEKRFMLTIDGKGNRVYYTTDGSEPDTSSNLYTGAIEIVGIENSPRSVQGVVAQERIETGTVIRAICVDNDGNASGVVTNTYFVSPKIKELSEKVPIVALSAKPYDLWDGREGIYTNYDYEHNIPAYVEYFDQNGEGFERGIEMKVGGHGSRSNAKKSLRLYFTKGDALGRKNLEYDLIEGTDKNFYNSDKVQKYGKITFRISDWSETDLKDLTAQKITEFMRPETANSTPAALFLNGEFWGIYECREQYDDRYVDFHYEDIDKDDVVFLDRDWTNENSAEVLTDTGEVYTDRVSYEEGPEEDEAYYKELFSYTKYLMTNASEGDNYSELEAYLDIDNFIDYMFVYLYADNIDWPGNNYKFWRTSIERTNGDVYGADGKWRFMVHDFDLAFDNAENNTLEYAIKSTLPDTEPRTPGFAARTLDGMMNVSRFRTKFAQRAAAYISTAVSYNNMDKIVSALIAGREGVKARDLMRWNLFRGTSEERLSAWKQRTRDKFLSFVSRRNEVFFSQIADFYKKYYQSDLSGAANISFVTDADKVSVSVSGAVIRKSFYGDMADSFTTKQYANIPLEIGGEAKEGYKIASITVASDAGSTTYQGSGATFTPEANKPYTVTLNIEEGQPDKADPADFFILREGRFEKMKVGEKLPIDASADGGERVFGMEAYTDSDCIEIGDNNIIRAVKPGEATVTVAYKGQEKKINIKITE